MSALQRQILERLRASPSGLTKRRLAFLLEETPENVDAALRALQKRDQVDEKTGDWWFATKQADEQPAAAPEPAPPVERFDPHARRPRRTCLTCQREKGVVAFYAGDQICRKCRLEAGGGCGAGPALDVTPNAPHVRPDGALEIPAGTVAFPLPGGELPARQPTIARPPMPEAVRAVLEDLETKKVILEAGIAAIRAAFA